MSTDIWGLGGAWNPISFSVEFIARMRKEKKTLINGPPSSRQALAIPKLLTARFMRKHTLIPEDYIQSAVLTTPIEDQEIAREIAYRILFPKSRKEKKKKTEDKETDIQPKASPVAQSIMNEMSLLDEIDIDNLISDDEIDDMLEQELDTLERLFDFLDHLENADNSITEALKGLTDNRGGEEIILQQGIENEQQLMEFLKDEVMQQVNSLSAADLINATEVGWGEELLQNTKTPWEELLLQHELNKEEFQKNLENLIQDQDLSTGAKTLSYLEETKYSRDEIKSQIEKLVEKADEIWELAELSNILDEIPEFNKNEVMENSLADLGRSFRTCNDLDAKFETNMRNEMFDTYKEQLEKSKQKPSLEDLAMSATDCQDWRDMLDDSMSDEIEKSLKSKNPSEELSKLAKKLDDFQTDLEKLTPPHNHCSKDFENYASEIAKEALNQIKEKDEFLDKLSDFLDMEISLDKNEILPLGHKKNIPPEEILEVFGGSFEILKTYMETNIGDFFRYSHMMEKLGMGQTSLSMSKGFSKAAKKYPGNLQQDFGELVQTALKADNQEALGALGHANMQMSVDIAQGIGGNEASEAVIDSMTRGSGENLLLQWFYHRHRLPEHVKRRVRDLAKKALIEVAMNWPTGKLGSGDRGLVPSLEMRPYRDGDELDQIDIDSTIEGVLLGGKSPEMITLDDLMVWDTSRGRVAACFLLDISGSMGSQKLAMCAISVVMMVGKLKPEEIAVAFFESNTHKIKEFDEQVELDEVADELLGLTARGGTVLEGALRWGADQLEGCTEAEEKLMMVFTDACVEQFSHFEKQLERYIHQQVRFIMGLNKGRSCTRQADEIAEAVDGEIIVLKSVHEIPKILADILSEIK